MKILLAIDDSSSSRAALKEVANRAWPKGSTVLILTAYDLQLGPMAKPWLFAHDEERILKAQRDQAQRLVEDAATKLRASAKSQLRVKTKTVQGRAERSILEEADRASSDLIVLGSHGHTAWERLILGSTAHTVALHAPCSVEIIRRRRRKHSKR